MKRAIYKQYCLAKIIDSSSPAGQAESNFLSKAQTPPQHEIPENISVAT
jgi:hypothetical protein